MAVKLAVIYYSSTGTVYELAQAVEAGAKAGGAEVRLLRVRETVPEQGVASNPKWAAHLQATQSVPEAQLDDLEWADAVIFGTPTRFGLPAAQLKQYIDSAGGLWFQGKLANKVVSSFTSAATTHGGHETTLVALNNTFYHWGAIIVPPGYNDQVQFQTGTPYGTTFVSNNGELTPDDASKASAEFQGRRVAEIAAQLIAGRS
ncbi:MAG: NAD(P)H:quinone oxidoreductase [Chloroflexota bacterium]